MNDANGKGNQLLEAFVYETNSMADSLEEILLRSEQSGSMGAEEINEIFRIMHTVKGSSAMMSFQGLTGLTHRLEDCFSLIRENGVSGAHFSLVMDLMLDAAEYIKEQLERILDTGSDEPSPALAERADALRALLEGEETGDPEPAGEEGPYRACILFDEDCGMENLRAFMLVNALREELGIVEFHPGGVETDSATAKEIRQQGFRLILRPAGGMEQACSVLENFLYVRSVELSPLEDSAPEERTEPLGERADQSAPEGGGAQTADRRRAGRQELIPVSLSKLDALMDLMGELVITGSMVTGSPDLEGLPGLGNFRQSSRQLNKITGELQEVVMSLRMVSLSPTFQRMQRVVRDMCRSLGKEASLVLEGGDTDVDKAIVDGITDPVLHLVRNCMDHGIEPPEERDALGKPPGGTITLSARTSGGEILVTVSDDGKGLDAAALLAKAAERGLLTRPPEEYSQREAFQLLTLPGFSTKEEITEFSGRGVGLDVVKRDVERIGGSVVIDSEPGQGSSTTLRIPLTLAVTDGIKVAVGEDLFILPVAAVRESFYALPQRLTTDTDGNEMILIRGGVYPIIRLHQLYGISNATTDPSRGVLVWVRAGERSACLLVDDLIGEQQIVVKPLPAFLLRMGVKHLGFSGCTILGDGTISLILDAAGIIRKALERR